MNRKIRIYGVDINAFSYRDFISIITEKINSSEKSLITYANANTINLTYKNQGLKKMLNSFSYIHPDGIGIYLASKLLFGKNGLHNRMTGSDFYPVLIKKAKENNWKIFFLGHDNQTLNKITENNPELNICGKQQGYDLKDDEIINLINKAKPDLLIIGLGFPKQELWINKFRNKLDFKVCLCAGEGFKVFAGTKTRGPEILRKLGLEWFVRLIRHPSKYFTRYVIGNPLFLYRIIILKIRKFRE